MVTVVKITCKRCQTELKLDINELCLLVPNVPSRGKVPPRLNMVCTVCGECEQVLNESQVDLLSMNGIRVETFDVATEFVEEYPTGPPINRDDLLAFHEELQQW